MATQLPEYVEMPMPKLVPTMKTGVLSKWLVEVGQEVQVPQFEFVDWVR